MNRSFSLAAALLVASSSQQQRPTAHRARKGAPSTDRANRERLSGFGGGGGGRRFVDNVSAGSAAEKAGLEEGDRIAAVNGAICG